MTKSEYRHHLSDLDDSPIGALRYLYRPEGMDRLHDFRSRWEWMYWAFNKLV